MCIFEVFYIEPYIFYTNSKYLYFMMKPIIKELCDTMNILVTTLIWITPHYKQFSLFKLNWNKKHTVIKTFPFILEALRVWNAFSTISTHWCPMYCDWMFSNIRVENRIKEFYSNSKTFYLENLPDPTQYVLDECILKILSLLDQLSSQHLFFF